MNNNKITYGDDLTGRERLMWNVISSWLSYLVLIIAGFVMPRLIDDHIGQLSLGVWDFSWSIVSYLNAAGLSIGSSMNRYVAKYRAAGELDNMKLAISSVAAIQLVISAVVILCILLLVFYLPVVLEGKLGSEMLTAQWVVALLGTTVAIHMAFDTYRGVITGFHRWDIYNGLHAGSHMVVVVFMITSMMMDGGLISLALIYFTVMFFTELVRMAAAHKIYPQLKIKPMSAQWSYVKMSLRYGSKIIIVGMPPLLLILTVNLLIISNLGPALLAIFSRPLALVRHMEIFLNKYFHILTPTTSSLLGSGKYDEIRHFLLQNTMYGVAFTLPLVIILSIYGDLLLTVWMGYDYVNHCVIAILAIGYFLPVSQTPVMRVMMGVNRHGRVGLASLMIVTTGLLIWVIFLNMYGWTLISAALMVGTTLTIANGMVMPVYSCKILKIPLLEYYKKVFVMPCTLSLVFALWLWSIRIKFEGQEWTTLLVGISSGLVILGVLYWIFIVPKATKTRIVSKCMFLSPLAK